MVISVVFTCTEPRSGTIQPRLSLDFFSRPAPVSCSHSSV